ncbi:hypothetical protein Brsp05_03432 [Brucella sp. NBRC 12953]|uniref:hypothetical protein n=1 Tax=Brucella sp. NBRC 12953 TaxID=3075481 RepID=UPI0030B58FBA
MSALLRSILDSLASFLGGSLLRKNLVHYCRIVTAQDDAVLIGDDGSLLSLFRLDGCRAIKGTGELSDAMMRLRLALASQFSQGGFTLQFWFGHLPEVARDELQATLSGIAALARDAELDVADLLDERLARLPAKLSGERAYIALWSRPTMLTREEASLSAKIRRNEDMTLPSSLKSQFPVRALQALLTRHKALVQSLLVETGRCDFDLELLGVRTALAEIKGILNPEFLSAANNWQAVLPGDHLRARMPRTAQQCLGNDVSHLLWPPLSAQLMSEAGSLRSDRVFEFGSKIFCGFDIVLGPEQIVAFNDLIARVRDQHRRMSWRVSMLLDSGGFQGQMFKEHYVNLLSFTSRITNGRIRRAFEAARQRHGDGETVIRWRACFAVWSDPGDERQLLCDVANLRQTVHGWGNCQTDMQVGDPVECVLASALALSPSSTAPAASAYLTEAFALAPFARPSSPWRRGAIRFRTHDGKAWAYQPGSSLQLGWVDIIVGQPGSGKSTLSNVMNLAIALSPQMGRSDSHAGLLPRISIIDIGPSSEGFISLLKEALPPKRRHEVMHLRLQNQQSHAVNPFDLQLGMRWPFPYELEYLTNLICLCCTGDDRSAPYDGISTLARATILEAYDYFSDAMNPKRYTRSDSQVVDRTLKDLGFTTDRATSWYEVVDYLFENGKYHEATLAQRFAVPVLADLINMSNRETVKEPFRDMHVESTGETVVVAFQRMVTAACRDFPLLAGTTRFSVADARIAAFDLEAVTVQSGAHAQRQSAVMYMLARHTLTTDFWLHADDLKDERIPQAVRAYHLGRVSDNAQMHKRLAYDEYHRTGGLQHFRKQNENDARIGRKTGVQQVYASQLIEDFDPQIQALANNFFFCNVPTENAMRALAETYHLTDAVTDALRLLHGPVPGQGAPFVAVMKLKSGRYIQSLINDIGPIETWALSTTQDDSALRALLYAALGPKIARQILARRFPDGTATPLFEARKAEMEACGMAIDHRVCDNIIRSVADEIIRGFRDV